eukprot:CAMPEP_0114551218 /NCGR_PEP_ID=MMETSP0114-20121206/6486_1 /TAXON_ID=31324 /ORGANISM="Goniomonas sp, Strain m" /LENGTH=63 /DNA_ID=CAMNT_0001736037 /DNA_START=38 /DNA_END=229 /DNA_ORIENTATION=-
MAQRTVGAAPPRRDASSLEDSDGVVCPTRGADTPRRQADTTWWRSEPCVTLPMPETTAGVTAP